MSKINKKYKKEFISKMKKGMEPGALIYQGNISPDSTTVSCYKIGKTNMESFPAISRVEEIPAVSKDYLIWLRVTGLENIAMMTSICEVYDIERITLEDILDTSHSPKFEYFEKYVFVIFKKLLYEAGSDCVGIKQVSIVLAGNVLLTFEEKQTEELDLVISRMSQKSGVFFAKGAAYLAYAIIDTTVDDYLGVLDKIQFSIEELEDVMVSTQRPINTDKLYFVKRLLNSFYRNTRFTDEIVDKLMKSLTFNNDNKISISYFKDLSDHALKLRDEINSCRETINAIYDENISRTQLQTGYFLNVLTVINVLLWPYIIISGIFGMNFQYLPFTALKHGFFISIGVMTGISVLLLLFFKKKKFF